MAKGSKGRREVAFRQFRRTPYSFTFRDHDINGDLYLRNCSKALEKKDCEEATCSVCMECPHNAVLLLCSSHDNGCRPYMCGTSFRYSNCLDQYKTFYTKVVSSREDEPLFSSGYNPVVEPGSGWPVEKCEVTELACPLCRGQVKGWTVVESAREYLNAKKRSCMQDDCAFVGTFKELRKHMRVDHPCAELREVDPTLEQKWRRIVREREREQEDVISTKRSTIPGAMIFGDYVIEGNHRRFETDEEEESLIRLIADGEERNRGFEAGLDSSFVHAFGSSGNDLGRLSRQPTHEADENAVGVRHTSPIDLPYQDYDNSSNDDNGDDGGSTGLVSRLRQHGRFLLGRSGRRRRQREAGNQM